MRVTLPARSRITPSSRWLPLFRLSSAEAQGLFAGLNLEYPVNPAVPPDPAVAAWGRFEADSANIADAGRLQTAAVMLMDRAGYR